MTSPFAVVMQLLTARRQPLPGSSSGPGVAAWRLALLDMKRRLSGHLIRSKAYVF